MDDFSTEETASTSDTLDMSVSAICRIDGKKKAYVSFSDKKRFAEGLIPDCRLTKNNGFSDAEAASLEAYLRAHLDELKKMAARINVMDAFMGKKS